MLGRGTGGGFGGTTEFFAFTNGGTARAITNANGNFDISRLSSPGTNIGSIEGSGNYFLGSKTLTVGGNNLSTTVSGVIQEGGMNGVYRFRAGLSGLRYQFLHVQSPNFRIR